MREAGGDRSGVTGGTRVLSDRIKVKITAGAGESVLDRMIAPVEGAVRRKTPNELALTVTLAGLTLGFLLVTVTLYPMAKYFDVTIPPPTLISLLVCQLGATVFTYKSDDIVQTILQFAKEHRVGHIIMGPSGRRIPFWRRLFGETSLLERLTVSNYDFKIVVTEKRRPE